MKINWVFKDKNWAFGNLCNHLIKKMPSHNHVTDKKDGDVSFVCSPNFFRFKRADNRTILHLDSNRWYDNKKDNK